MNIHTDPWLASNPMAKQVDRCFFDTLFHYSDSIAMTVNRKYLLCEHVRQMVFKFPSEFDIFAYVSEHAKHMLRNKETFIVFDMSNEGGHATFPHYNYFYQSSKKHQIPQEQIIFITGGHTEREMYKKLYPDTKIHTVMIHLEDFRVKYVTNFVKFNRVNGLLRNHNTKYFTYLTRRPRYWRSALTMKLHSDEYLLNRAILSHGMIEADESPGNVDTSMHFVDGDLIADPKNDPVIKYFKNHNKVIDSGTKLKLNQVYAPPTDLYNQVLFDVVGESYQARNQDCITEKTFKAINVGLPVLIWGTPGINRQLEKLGFKLYDDWFDYSFDDEPDEWTRLNKLVDEIKRVCKYLDTLSYDERFEWSLQNKSVLNFNRDLLGNTPFIKSEINKLLQLLNGE